MDWHYILGVIGIFVGGGAGILIVTAIGDYVERRYNRKHNNQQ